jgi:uncharacterized membrane protein/predicted DsbA family dithiol-disulfide isomerase
MRRKTGKTQVKALPYPYYYFTVAILTVVGLFDSFYLAVSHYRVYTDMGYKSFCAISRALNCDTVAQSAYAVFLGVPVSIWGIIGYAFFLFLLAYAWPRHAFRRRVWTLLFFLSLGFASLSVVLAAVSTLRIHSYCLMCIVSYAVNLLLLFFCWIVRKRFLCENLLSAAGKDLSFLRSHARSFVPGFLCFGFLVVALLLFFPAYWDLSSPLTSSHLNRGVTKDGHPWIGAKAPKLDIVEFSDYRCFQCRKMHYYLRQLVASRPGAIRLVHRHFPMDHIINPLVEEPYHEGSAKLSIISLYALEKGKFWEMNDILFSISRNRDAINIRDLCSKAGISYEEIKFVFRDYGLWETLRKDVKAGLEYGLTGTPGFVINEEVFLGQIPPDILGKYVQ